MRTDARVRAQVICRISRATLRNSETSSAEAIIITGYRCRLAFPADNESPVRLPTDVDKWQVDAATMFNVIFANHRAFLCFYASHYFNAFALQSCDVIGVNNH